MGPRMIMPIAAHVGEVLSQVRRELSLRMNLLN